MGLANKVDIFGSFLSETPSMPSGVSSPSAETSPTVAAPATAAAMPTSDADAELTMLRALPDLPAKFGLKDVLGQVALPPTQIAALLQKFALSDFLKRDEGVGGATYVLTPTGREFAEASR